MKGRPAPAVTHPSTYLTLALFAFALLGFELLVPFVEPAIPTRVESVEAAMLHWIVTIVLWTGGALGLLAWSLRHTGFSLRGSAAAHAPTRSIIVVGLVALTLASQWLLRGGVLPPIAEYAALSARFGEAGMTAWLVQVAYYIVEVAVVALIIGFGQRAGEGWFHHPRVPWGGVILASTWGLVHFLTQDAATGVYGMALSLMMGVVYLLAGRSLLITFPILLVMFII
ncbi:hypothetical protein [Microbacterium sp. NPDC087665]|uniref:hypothetical protein n=1 Tax=Microbacterium sp. NPDC087665 TaxID=3364194 RepID=UPI0038297B6D